MTAQKAKDGSAGTFAPLGIHRATPVGHLSGEETKAIISEVRETGIYNPISSTDFLAFKQQAIANQSVSKMVPMKSIKLKAHGGGYALQYDGVNFTLSSQAVKSMMNLLNVKPKLLNTVGKHSSREAKQGLIDLLQKALLESISKSKSKHDYSSLYLHANFATMTISGLSWKDQVKMPIDKFFNLVEDSVSAKNLDIVNMGYDGGNIRITSINKNWGFDVPGMRDESFNTGLTFKNGFAAGTTVSPFLLRLVCANGSIIATEEQTIQLKELRQDHIQKFLSEVKNFSEQDLNTALYVERIKRMSKIQASLAEVEFLRGKMKDGAPLKQEEMATGGIIESFIPLAGFYNEYIAKTGIDLTEITSHQERLVKSPYNAWNLFNRFTDFASHNVGGITVPEYARTEMLHQAGKFMFRQGYDMEQIMPQIV
jgi:hypothetical protein